MQRMGAEVGEGEGAGLCDQQKGSSSWWTSFLQPRSGIPRYSWLLSEWELPSDPGGVFCGVRGTAPVIPRERNEAFEQGRSLF